MPTLPDTCSLQGENSRSCAAGKLLMRNADKVLKRGASGRCCNIGKIVRCMDLLDPVGGCRTVLQLVLQRETRHFRK